MVLVLLRALPLTFFNLLDKESDILACSFMSKLYTTPPSIICQEKMALDVGGLLWCNIFYKNAHNLGSYEAMKLGSWELKS